MDHDKELDALLSKRSVPEMRSNLEHRIIQASLKPAPEERGILGGIKSFMETISRNFVIPQPALVMTLVLLCGVIMGGYSDYITEYAGYTAASTSIDAELLIMDSEIDYGEFL